MTPWLDDGDVRLYHDRLRELLRRYLQDHRTGRLIATGKRDDCPCPLCVDTRAALKETDDSVA